MRAEKTRRRTGEQLTWEEESGLLIFLSKVHGEVDEFDKIFDLGIAYIAAPPVAIDGSAEQVQHVGFVVVRRNEMISGRTYCLYSVLKERVLFGYIGLYSDGRIETLRELKPLKDFTRGTAVLYDWLKELVRASCEKI